MSLTLVPVGAVVERVYYAVPESYSQGDEFPTFITAARAAIARADDIKRRVADSYPIHWDREQVEAEAERCAKTACVVDLRWKLRWPASADPVGVGGGLDAVIERTNVRHLSAEHCDRVEALHA
jgi:hypothetical protein